MKNAQLATLLIALTLSLMCTNAAVVHSHNSETNKERVEDGAFSPRGHSHYSDSGEHHSEFDHEAILGSHKNAEEFDHLSPVEAKKRLGVLLRKMDLTGDGIIDRQELKAWILRSFKMLSEEEAKDRLEDADEDNDGSVSWGEYLSDAYGVDNSKEGFNFDEENEHLIADDKLLWKAADTNGDNILNADEWVLFSHPEEHPAMLPLILEQTLRDKDKNNDGAIDFQEFVGDRALEQDKEFLYGEKNKFDQDLDKDGDGKLSGNEILSWVVPSNEEIADEEVEHLFAASDDDHDNLLSFEEILEHHDSFVGSEVTDYGDHLHNLHHFDDEL